ncbi:hypothetical protein ACFLZH_00120 [Patescibacteria group bacterium]
MKHFNKLYLFEYSLPVWNFKKSNERLKAPTTTETKGAQELKDEYKKNEDLQKKQMSSIKREMAKLNDNQLTKVIQSMKFKDVFKIAKISNLSQRTINILVNHKNPLVKIAVMTSNTSYTSYTTKILKKLSKDRDKRVAKIANRILTKQNEETQRHIDSLDKDFDM